jgi:hypothetical protein
MSLFEKIMALYPELTPNDFHPANGTITLQNDGDGDYIAKWEHLTLPEPTAEQLA